MPANPQLDLSSIDDPFIRDNFKKLAEYFSAQNQLLDFKFVEMDFTAAVVQQKVAHGLTVIPRDLLRLEVTGAGKVTFHKGLFDKQFLVVSTNGAAHVRLFAGLYKDSNTGTLAESVTEEWKATL